MSILPGCAGTFGSTIGNFVERWKSNYKIIFFFIIFGHKHMYLDDFQNCQEFF